MLLFEIHHLFTEVYVDGVRRLRLVTNGSEISKFVEWGSAMMIAAGPPSRSRTWEVVGCSAVSGSGST